MKELKELRFKTYIPTVEEIKACRLFAQKCVGTNKDCYARRGQTNAKKIIDDITIGKIGEIAVYHLLQKMTSQVDFKVYGSARKSYEADLFLGNIGIHIKNQKIEQAKQFGTSWMFQKNDNLPDDDYCVFCVAGGDELNYTVKIFQVLEAKKVKEKFDKPKSPKLQHSKNAIYYKDVKCL